MDIDTDWLLECEYNGGARVRQAGVSNQELIEKLGGFDFITHEIIKSTFPELSKNSINHIVRRIGRTQELKLLNYKKKNTNLYPVAHNYINYLIRKTKHSLLDQRKNFKSEFFLTEEEILNKIKQQDGKCFYTGLEFYIPKTSEESRVINPYKLSLERINSLEDYTPENVVLTCCFANRFVSTFSHPEKIKALYEMCSLISHTLKLKSPKTLSLEKLDWLFIKENSTRMINSIKTVKSKNSISDEEIILACKGELVTKKFLRTKFPTLTYSKLCSLVSRIQRSLKSEINYLPVIRNRKQRGNKFSHSGFLARQAKKTDSKSTLTEEIIERKLSEQKGLCFYSGVEMFIPSTQIERETANSRKVSIERINPYLGYFEENIVLVCSGINFFVASFTHPEKIKALGEMCYLFSENLKLKGF